MINRCRHVTARRMISKISCKPWRRQYVGRDSKMSTTCIYTKITMKIISYTSTMQCPTFIIRKRNNTPRTFWLKTLEKSLIYVVCARKIRWIVFYCDKEKPNLSVTPHSVSKSWERSKKKNTRYASRLFFLLHANHNYTYFILLTR